MHARIWKLAAIVGTLTGIVVSAIMTFLDWRLNPGGIFHNDAGTNWTIVAETAFSWLWPVALIAFAATAVVLYAIRRIRPPPT